MESGTHESRKQDNGRGVENEQSQRVQRTLYKHQQYRKQPVGGWTAWTYLKAPQISPTRGTE